MPSHVAEYSNRLIGVAQDSWTLKRHNMRCAIFIFLFLNLLLLSKYFYTSQTPANAARGRGRREQRVDAADQWVVVVPQPDVPPDEPQLGQHPGAQEEPRRLHPPRQARAFLIDYFLSPINYNIVFAAACRKRRSTVCAARASTRPCSLIPTAASSRRARRARTATDHAPIAPSTVCIN